MKVGLSELKEILIHTIKAVEECKLHNDDSRPVILLNGPTGVGKTTTLKAIAEELGFELIDVRLSRELPENIGGIPVFANGDEDYFRKKLHYKFKAAFEKRSILFFDEFNRANQYTQNSIMSILYERELEGKKLHPETIVVLAINTGSDYTATEIIDKAFLARCLIINVVADSFPTGMREHFINNYGEISNLIFAKERELIRVIDNDVEELFPTKSLRNLQFAIILLKYCFENNISKDLMDKLLLTAVHPDVFTILQSSLLNFEIIEKIIRGEKVNISEKELSSVMLMLSFYSYKSPKEIENTLKFCLNILEKKGYDDTIIPVLKNIKSKNEMLFIKLVSENKEMFKKLSKILERIKN